MSSPETLTEKNTPWRGWIQLFLGLGITVLFFSMMAPFVVAIFLGATIAILCYPVFDKFLTRLPRSLAALSVTILVTLGVLVPFVLTLYLATYRTLDVVSKYRFLKDSHSIEQLIENPTVKKFLTQAPKVIPINKDWIYEQTLEFLQVVIEKLSGAVGRLISGMPGILMAFFVVIVSTYFFLVDGGKFLKFLRSLSPIEADRSIELYTAFETSCRGVVLGLFASALAQALLMTLFFAVTGLPNAILMGLVTVGAGMLPLVGSAPLWIGATLYHGLNGNWGNFTVMLVGGLMIVTIDNIIRPLIMKDHAQMHPMLALISVLGAVNLMGATGIFLGPIIAAVFVSFLKILSLELTRDKAATSPTTA
jgi:predicted PurR-regulated permease PerM